MQCSACGYQMDAFDKDCPRCHGQGLTKSAQDKPTPFALSTPAPLTSAPPTSTAIPQTAAPPPLPQAGSYCSHCGNAVSTYAQFCEHCGQVVGVKPSSAPPVAPLKPPASQSEKVLYQGPANLFRGIESVGGRLCITNYRIAFQSHSAAFKRGTTEIALHEVAQVQRTSTMGIIPNGLLVRTHAGQSYRFVVQGREQLMKLFEQLLASSR